MVKEPNPVHETTIRMDEELSSRLSMASQLFGLSRNAIMVKAIKELLLSYESDPDYQERRKQWLSSLAKVGRQ